jgi:hypothetical protein
MNSTVNVEERSMPATRKNTTVQVIAILQLVFGGLGLVCNLCSGLQVLAGNNTAFLNFGGAQQAKQIEMQEQTQKLMDAKFPANRAFSIGNVIASLVISVMTIISGIALLGMRSWGRTLAICAALASLLLTSAELVYTFLVALPVMNEAAEILAKQGQQEAMAARFIPIAGYITVFVLVFTMVYPIVVLVMMLLPSTAAAFRDKDSSSSAEEPQDFLDEDRGQFSGGTP